MDTISYSLAKKYTNLVAIGLASATVDDVNKSITFTLAADSSQHTIHFNQPSDGQDGISVVGVNDLGNGKFTLLFSDGTESDEIQTIKGQKGDKGDKLTFNDLSDVEKESLKGADGEKGEDGFSPSAKVEKVGDTATITITDKDGTTTATIKDGQGGTGGSGEENVIESIKVNGVTQTVSADKSVDITVPTKTSDLSNDSGFLTEHQDLSGYVQKEDGKGLSSNDYTTEEKDKLAGLENYDDTQVNADITSLSNRIKSVEDEVPNLATKTYVGEQIANADHLKREIVEALPSDEDAKDNIIYMLKVESAVGNDKYREYMKIDGTVQLVGDTSVDLTDYIKTSEVNTKLEDYAKTEDVNASIETLQTDKADASDLTAHTDNEEIHVTAEDKELWNTVSDKVDKEDGKGLSSNDYTDEEKALVETIEDKIDKTSIATTLSSESTNDEVVGAKLAYDELQKLESATKNQFNTASGDFITVNDSVDGNIIELGIKGNSYQQTYSGKNLLNTTLETTTISGVTCTNNGDGTFTLTGGYTGTDYVWFLLEEFTLQKNQNIKVVGCPSGGGFSTYRITVRHSQDTVGAKYDDGKGIIFTASETENHRIYMGVKLSTISTPLVFKPMIVDADLYPDVTYDDFEPYVGSHYDESGNLVICPSPNPNYPQAINSVADDGSLVVTSCGKNVLKNLKGDSFSHMGITYTKNSDGSISCTGTQTNHSYLLMNNDLKVDLKGKYILSGNTTTNSNEWGYCLFLQLELEDGALKYIFNNNPDEVVCDFSQYPTLKYVRPYIRIGKDAAALTDKTITFYPMLRPYGTDGTYEPYKETTTTIPFSEPLRAIGDVKDEITYQDGKWGVLRRIGEKVISSTLKINPDGALVGEIYDILIDLGTFKDSYCVVNQISDISKSIFDKFVSKNTWAVDECGAYISWAGNAFARMSSSICGSTLDEVNTYLSNNPITTDYVLATPVFEPFADQTLPYLSTYDGVTNIFNDDALSAEMTVKYPTTDVSGVGSRNEAKIVELTKDTDERFDDVNLRATELKVFGWNVPTKFPVQNYVDGDGVLHQKVARVDMGTLNWVYWDESSHERFSIQIADIKKVTSNGLVGNLQCKIYTTTDANGTYLHRNDKTISVDTNQNVNVYDTAYTDADTFKSAMQGVYLYYELAEEKVIDVDGNEIIGSTDISGIGDGTVTGAISAVNGNLEESIMNVEWKNITPTSITGGTVDVSTLVYRKIGCLTQLFLSSTVTITAKTNVWIYLPDEVFEQLKYYVPASNSLSGSILTILRPADKAILIQSQTDINNLAFNAMFIG